MTKSSDNRGPWIWWGTGIGALIMGAVIFWKPISVYISAQHYGVSYGAMQCVEAWRNRFNDPLSVYPISDNKSLGLILVQIRAKNAFGAYLPDQISCIIGSTGDVSAI